MNTMINALTRFLSNKINVYILIALGYLIIGYTWTQYGVSLMHQVMIWVIMFLISFLVHLLGVSRGMFIASVHKKEISEFMDMVKKMGETEDDEE